METTARSGLLGVISPTSRSGRGPSHLSREIPPRNAGGERVGEALASRFLEQRVEVLLDLLAEQPLVTAKFVAGHLGRSPTTVTTLLDKTVAAGIVSEVTGRRRNRVYRYSSYLDLFTADEPALQALPYQPWP